jgi:hypothetical protein
VTPPASNFPMNQGQAPKTEEIADFLEEHDLCFWPKGTPDI